MSPEKSCNNIGRNPSSKSFFIETYGCQMNIADSNDIRHMLVENGFKDSDDLDSADIIIINTCSVRATAEQRIRGRLGYFKKLKREKNRIVVLTGCVAERLSEQLLYEFPDLDIVLGTHFKSNFVSAINTYIKDNERKSYTGFHGYSFVDSHEDKEQNFRAYVPVIHGCNNFCSYCIVPYTRGREISRSSGDIIRNIKKLVEKGVKEVVLLGQNVNSYGKDRGDVSFSQLLSKVSTLTDVERIRFITSHPKDFTKELAEIIAYDDKVCKYLHLPFQSASDKVLKAMGRNYTFKSYMDNIDYMRKLFPNIALSTDVLVGFPTENDDDYRMTLEAIKKIQFDTAFMFKYSVREGTKASKGEDSVPEKVKLERLQEIIYTQNNITKSVNKKRIGMVEKVLFDYKAKNNTNGYIGKTDSFKNVVVDSESSIIGNIENVKLDSLSGNTFIGKIV